MTTQAAFARAEEAEAYRVLHNGGLDALDDTYGVGISRDLIKRWFQRRMVRISYNDNGGLVVRAFKKYTGRGATIRAAKA